MIMKKNILFLLLSTTTLFCFSQDKIAESLGTKTLYQPKQNKYAKTPVGFEPVYINYVGRHGARHLTKDIKISSAYIRVSTADSLNELTADGKYLKQLILNLGKEEEGHVASISKSGEDELKGIAERMFDHHKSIFVPAKPILVSTTKKGRTKESAEAFLEGLKSRNPVSTEKVTFNFADDDHLRFYDFSKTYDEFKEKGNWIGAYQKLAESKQLKTISNKFTSKFFKSGYLYKLTQEDKIAFTEDIYGFYTILNAVGAEIKQAGLTAKELDFKSLFSMEDLSVLGTLGDAEDFLTKGPGINNNGIQVRIAAPLLADFINTTDAFLKSKPVGADLRFSHAETIAPFAAIMNIKGASESANDVMRFNQNWKAENVIPFSANIQWIFYQNKSNGKYLVKFLLNEKEAVINCLPTNSFPFYTWSSVRAFYLKRLKMLNFGLQDDAHKYLLNVK
ncbi:histidine-type phosphatase [Pedobacter ginsengiterrae]|uniref:Multiple inositol polyphosphate phosphatase 1 n=2 Tax=Pedobacter ginsengiterrae TaxID=871696 RepID=A0ABP7NPG4_9SPHI